MKGKQKLRAFVCVCALGITGLLASLAPRLLHFSLSGISNMPPGARVAQRQLVTVWICGDLPGASAWVQKQAAAYGKRMPGVSVWLRTVTAGELDSLADTLPDVLLFTADAPADPDLLQELEENSALSPERAARGRWAGAQRAVPLCLSGYAAVERTPQRVTEAPRSLFGVPPTAEPQPRSAPEPVRWPERLLADDHFGALALAALDAPFGASLSARADAEFLSDENAAALLSIRQAQTAAQTVGLRVITAAPATDLVLYGGVTGRSGEAAAGFLDFLLSESAQQALAACSLIPARQGLRLYGGDHPLLSALENALAEGWLAPAFSWAETGKEILLTAQALYAAGQRATALLN